MVLYHRGIPCIVLVDFKIGKLDSRDIGQMNKYIGFWRRNKQYEHEQPTIGLIICRKAGREEVSILPFATSRAGSAAIFKRLTPVTTTTSCLRLTAGCISAGFSPGWEMNWLRTDLTHILLIRCINSGPCRLPARSQSPVR